MPLFTLEDVTRYRRAGRGQLREFSSDASKVYYVAPTTRYAQPLATGVYYTILANRRHAELVIVHKNKVSRQPPIIETPRPAKLVIVDDVQTDIPEILRAGSANTLRMISNVREILYFTPTRRGDLHTETISTAEEETLPLVEPPTVTSDNIARFERLSLSVLAAFASDPRSFYYVAGTRRDAQPYTSSAFYTIFNNRAAELVVYHRGGIVRQPPRIERPDMKTRLVVVDAIQGEQTIESLRNVSEWLKKKHFVQETLYLANTLTGELFSEVIPPRQTGQSADSPGAAPQ